MNPSVPQSVGCACSGPSDTSGRLWWRIAAGAFLAGNTMTAALAINTAEATRTERLAFHAVLIAATLLVTLLLGGPLLRETAASLRAREIRIEALFMLSWVGAVSASMLSVLRGEGAVFFEVASILLVVYSLGRELGRYSTQKALHSLAAWDPHVTHCLMVDELGQVVETPIASVLPGQRVRVHPAQMVPVDGVVVHGRAFVHQADLTGESFAVSVGPADSVMAGSHVLDSTLDVRATASGVERAVDRITAVLESLRRSPSHWQLTANRLMGWFLPLLLLICVAVAVFWYHRSGWETAVFNTMAVLLVACPCVLGFATPLAVWTGMSRLSSLGLLARNGAALERLASIDTVVFDKTGTLTLVEVPSAELHIHPLTVLAPELVRRLVIAAEQHCQHPIAEAIRQLPGDAGTCRTESIEVLPGTGVRTRVREGTGKLYEVTIGTLGEGIGVWIDGTWSATIELQESLCGSISSAVRSLERLGLRCILMTGDRDVRSRRIPVGEQYASLTPDDKRERVLNLTNCGRRVLFVGDGTNDAAAMAASSVSVALSGGSPLAVDAADFIWTRDDLEVLPQTIGVAREIAKTVRSNIWLALVYNLAGISLAAAGSLHPVAAAILMMCSSSLVTWRSLQALPQPAPPPTVESLA